jgi:hypothetical protein
MMSDFNFNQIPSEIKYFIPGKETVNDIPNLFGSLLKMKIPQDKEIAGQPGCLVT